MTEQDDTRHNNTLGGVVPILLTPFDDDGRIDEESLGRLIELNLATGVHGLGVALGSEVFKLTESERTSLVRTTSSFIRGRVPLVVNTSAEGTDLAISYARAAQDAGADALMIVYPWLFRLESVEVIAHYGRISDAVSIPIVLQDIPQAPIPPSLAVALSERCESIRYIKVERPPTVSTVGEMCAAVGDKLTVFGGAGGGYFIEEMRRGSGGTMPFASLPAAFVEIWSRFHAGDEAGAMAVFASRIAPIERLTAQADGLAFHVHKQLLVKQGVFRSATVRGPSRSIDAVTQTEIDRVLDHLLAQ